MERRIIETRDGSRSVEVCDWNVSFHSMHGAVTESRHIYIGYGLLHKLETKRALSVFEMGFGTGLNAFLTYDAASSTAAIRYECCELYPLSDEITGQLDYAAALEKPYLHEVFKSIHSAPWNEAVALSPAFMLHKRMESIIDMNLSGTFDVVYFDAFDPLTQPALWTTEVFVKIRAAMAPGGVLVTYCSRGSVRRAMKAAGFQVEKLPGPPGKREVVRAWVV